MRDLGSTYMDFMAHPDEPEFSGADNPVVRLEVGMANRNQLKRRLLSQFFQNR